MKIAASAPNRKTVARKTSNAGRVSVLVKDKARDLNTFLLRGKF